MQQKFRRMIHNQSPTKSEAYQKHRTCDRKKVYTSYAEGWKAVKHIQKNGNDLYPDFELRPYLCRYCQQIHVGHTNTPRSTELLTSRQATDERSDPFVTANLRQYSIAGSI